MSPKDAIIKAKDSVADLFESDGVQGIRLEEIRFDDGRDSWLVTVGFERPRSVSVNGVVIDLTAGTREYKVVSISDATGETVSVTNRPFD